MTINLIDTNDHFPEFPQSVYVLSVMENSPAGTIIAPNITVRHWAGQGTTRPPGVQVTSRDLGVGRKWRQGWGTLHSSGTHFWGAHRPWPVPQVRHHPRG